MHHSRVGSWAYPRTLDQAGESCQGQTLYLITNNRELWKQNVYDIGPSGMYYKNFIIVIYDHYDSMIVWLVL